ncbi:MAG: 3-phosphoshikimate 1-carboxyvinyltransferase [Aquiluna sp.]|nr:3-phosphoshikimate 1-carboxyvinyltransferase [Aquiluna sp.]MCF8545339.1 3-phosphoshikimate 1-carboxyvinyltransferase [Aquiluna sp.]
MTQAENNWSAPQAAGLDATVLLPGSKSLTNRELVLSALAEEPTLLVAPLVSRDSLLMIAALESLGTKFERQDDNLLVTPQKLKGPAAIDCGLAGTVMRFLPPLATLATGVISFDGDLGARARPMHTTIDSLQALGVDVGFEEKSLPFEIHATGSVDGGELEIDASASSQFVSGLLLVAAKFINGLTLKHVGKDLPSLPHIEMTLEVLRQRGVDARALSETTWRVEPGVIKGGRVVIEPDLSNAGPFLAAAMVAGGEVRIPNWPTNTTQVGAEFQRILPMMGAEVTLEAGTLTLQSDGKIKGIDIDLSIGGELAPVIAALAALADSPSQITGIAHLRGHETDRLAALCAEINRLGGAATELPDGIEIQPKPLSGGIWQTYHDHRMATAGAIIGLVVPGVEVENIATTSKTMPGFVDLWTKMLGNS